jgi:hypothetical protein
MLQTLRRLSIDPVDFSYSPSQTKLYGICHRILYAIVPVVRPDRWASSLLTQTWLKRQTPLLTKRQKGGQRTKIPLALPNIIA